MPLVDLRAPPAGATSALVTVGIALVLGFGGEDSSLAAARRPRARTKAGVGEARRASARGPIRRPARPRPMPRQILAELGHDDPARRADAAWEAGRQRLGAAAPGLKKLLRDRDAAVRRSAAWALGEIGRPESAFVLHDRILREHTPTVQAELAVALGKVRYRATRNLLLGLTWKEDPILQAAGITAVGHLGDPTVVPYLLRFRTHPDPVLRRALAQTLGRLGGPRARQALLGLLGDQASSVQEAALEAARDLGMTEAAPHAETFLDKGPFRLKRVAAIALRVLGTQGHVAALTPLVSDEHPEVAAEGALTVAMLGGEVPTDRLRTLLGSRHNAAIRAAAEAAGLAGNRALIPLLESLLDHPSAPLREAAAQALGRLNASQSLPKLAERLSDASPSELAALLGAIGMLRDASYHTAVLPLLSHSDVGVRAAAVRALDQMARQDPRPFTLLPRLLVPLMASRWPPALLCAAADAFASLPPPRPREGFVALARLTWHAEAAVREAAARSLGRYGDRLARPTVERLRRDPDAAVRLEAGLALLRLGSPRGRVTPPEEVLPDCRQLPPGIRERCLLVRAAWLPRERAAAAKAFRRVLGQGPNRAEVASLVERLAALDASFAVPLLQEARRSPLYLLRSAADRALSIWPGKARPSPAGVTPPPEGPDRSARIPGSPSPAPEIGLFDPKTSQGGCDCRHHRGGAEAWILALLGCLVWLGRGLGGLDPKDR